MTEAHSNTALPDTTSSAADRAVWVTPVVTRIEAGSAENAAGPVLDDGVNQS